MFQAALQCMDPSAATPKGFAVLDGVPARSLPPVARPAGPALLPASYLRLLVEIMAERGVEPRLLLESSGLSLSQLTQPGLRIRADEAARIALRASGLSGADGLGFELGLRLQPTTHGPLGYALLCCPSIEAAVELMLRFTPLRQPFFEFQVGVEADRLVLQLRDLQQVGRLRHCFHEILLVGAARTLELLLGEAGPACELWFDCAEPRYYANYRERLPPLRYGMPATQLRLPLALLQRRPPMADASALRAALEACEREQVMVAADSMSQRVLAQLQSMPGVYPGLETVAARLCVSPRTLKRHLAKAGTTYQELLDGQRQRAAMRLLARPELSLRKIGELLGYGDPSSFTRAFRRWNRKTPAQARSELGSSAIVGAAEPVLLARTHGPPRAEPTAFAIHQGSCS